MVYVVSRVAREQVTDAVDEIHSLGPRHPNFKDRSHQVRDVHEREKVRVAVRRRLQRRNTICSE